MVNADLALRAAAAAGNTDRIESTRTRTAIAVLPIANDRLRVLLAAYLTGPGRGHFDLTDGDSAKLLIADADSSRALAELRHRLSTQARPAVAIGRRDPALRGAVWLPWPFTFDDLLRAVNAAGPLAAQMALPGVDARAEEAARALPAPMSHPPTGLGAATRAARTPFGRRAEGDWTGTAAWLLLGLLAIAGAAAALGWRPATEPPSMRMLRASAAVPAGPDEALRRSVADSLLDFRGHSVQELEEIRLQLQSLENEQRLAREGTDRQRDLEALLRPGIPEARLRYDPQRVPVVLMAPAQPVAGERLAAQRALNDAVRRAVSSTGPTHRH